MDFRKVYSDPQKWKKFSGALGLYQKMLDKVVKWLRRLFNWKRLEQLKHLEIRNRVELVDANFQYK